MVGKPGIKARNVRHVPALRAALGDAAEQQRLGTIDRIAAARTQGVDQRADQLQRSQLRQTAARTRLAPRRPQGFVQINIAHGRYTPTTKLTAVVPLPPTLNVAKLRAPST